MLSEIFSSIKKLLWSSSSKPNNSLVKIINVKIVSSTIGVLLLEVKQDEIVVFLKKIIMEAIGKSSEEMLMKMKLIRVKTGKELSDFDCLDIIDQNEEFLLKYRRNEIIGEHLFLPGPRDEDIFAKTSNQVATTMLPIADFGYLLFIDDIKKLFITLAQECAYIIGVHPYSSKLIMFYTQKIHNYMKNQECAFKVMCQLGFAPTQVTKSLLLNANNYKLALDWLIDNSEHQEVATDILRSSKSPRSSISSNRRNSILSSKFNSASSTVSERVDGLLEIVSFYCEKDEPVAIEFLAVMFYMGFEAESAREALRVTNNNFGAACAHLAGEEHPSILELRQGLSHSSSIYETLLKSPKVQELISFPESFVYFLTFIDKRAFEWNTFEHNNGELMQYIVDLYHEEKHSLAVNQFNNSLIPISALSATATTT